MRLSRTGALSRLRLLAGWPGAGILAAVYVLVEILAIRGIGGNSGGFLFVTWHFGLAPLLAAAASVLTIVAAASSRSLAKRLLMISSLVVPALIIMSALTGHPGLLRFLSFR
jgi:hypothetical protein